MFEMESRKKKIVFIILKINFHVYLKYNRTLYDKNVKCF
jgi:hypothetical protein